MTASKQPIYQATTHTLIHLVLKLMVAMLALVCVQLVRLGISDQVYGILGVVPVFAGMVYLIFKTYLKTQRVRGDKSGFEVLTKGQWEPHTWQEISHVGRAFWAFSPAFHVIELQIGTDGEKVLFFGGEKEKALIESLRS